MGGGKDVTLVVQLYTKEMAEGRAILHGQPAHAKSWMTPGMRKMMGEQGLWVAETDQ